MWSTLVFLPFLAISTADTRYLFHRTSLNITASVSSQVRALYNFTIDGAWIENLAVRSNGNLLVTRFDAPELWSIDTTTQEATQVATFDDCIQSAGIIELGSDVFAVITGNFTLTDGATAGSWAIRKVDFNAGSSTPAVSTIATLPDAEFLNGLTKLDDDNLLMGDMTQGLIYKLVVSTGEYNVVAQDASMEPAADAPLPAGIDGVRYHGGFIYFSNIYGKTFNRVAVDSTSGSPTGAVENIFENISADDFAFSTDGSAYVATNADNTVVKVTTDGKVTVVADVTGATSVVFGRTEADENTLYVGGDDGAISKFAI
ncbi:NHL repeat-containing protein [Xylariaceae sp. FL0804]|nr:NHL repeat-containing protein [Xylariaceae sp. FL0804]